MVLQWQLSWRRFRKRKMALASGVILLVFYLLAAFGGFIAPYDPNAIDLRYAYAPPQQPHIFDKSGTFHLRPFIYGIKYERSGLELDSEVKHPIYFFVKGSPYEMWGLFEMDCHLFGLGEEGAYWFIFGADSLGRDMFSRIAYGTRIPMLLSLSGVLLSLILGILLGAKWGCYTFAYGIPVIILSETWLSFIGLGFRPPAISWGVLLQSWWRDLDNAGTVPQLLLPGVVMVLAVAAFKLVGDGLHGAIVGNT